MKPRSNNNKAKAAPSTKIGAAIGFVAFVVVGAIPSLLYGAYMGLMVAGAILGPQTADSILWRVITGGGMLLGFGATMSLFLVVGAVVGTGIGALAKTIVPAAEGENELEKVKAKH